MTSQSLVELEHVKSIKNLGVIVDEHLSFSEHIHEKINIAYSMLGIMKRNFASIDKTAFTMLYKSLVRSHLEYANSVWSPHSQTLKREIEKVQKRATKMVKTYKNLHTGKD
jgi:hypothetical protein